MNDIFSKITCGNISKIKINGEEFNVWNNDLERLLFFYGKRSDEIIVQVLGA